MRREEFLDRINQEGFSFSIDMTRSGDFRIASHSFAVADCLKNSSTRCLWNFVRSSRTALEKQGIIVA